VNIRLSMLGGAAELTRTQVCSWIGAENETPVDFIKPLNLYLHSDEPGWHPSPPPYDMYVSNHYSRLSPPKRDSAFGADPHAKRCHAAAVSDMPPSDRSNDVAVSSCPTAASATFPMRYWRQYRFHLMAAPSERIAQESDRPSGIVHCATTRCSSYRLPHTAAFLQFTARLPPRLITVIAPR
jgi:hypothetical protein